MVEAYQQGPDFIVEEPPFITLRFSKLQESSRSGYYAKLRVSILDVPGIGSGVLFNSNLIFGGPRSKADAIRSCESKCPSTALGMGIAWTAIIERAVDAVERLVESGDPFSDLSADPEPTERPYLVDKLLRYEEPTLLYGIGGSQKSYLALALAASIADGAPYLGLTAHKESVGYLDYEDVEDTHKQRLERLRIGWGLARRSPVWYKPASLSLVSMADSLSRQLSDNRVTVLIIDSAAMACNGRPEEAEVATAFFRALRSLRLRGCVILAHHRHGDNDHPYGSPFWWNQSRSIWLQKKSQEPGDTDTTVGLIHKKINNGTLFKPLGFRFTFEPDATVISPTDAAKLVDLRAVLSDREQVYQAIREQPGITRDELFLACSSLNPKFTRNNFRQALYRLRQQVTDISGKLWLRAEEA